MSVSGRRPRPDRIRQHARRARPRPRAAALSRASATASGAMSVATTRASGCSQATEQAMQPEPVQRSATRSGAGSGAGSPGATPGADHPRRRPGRPFARGVAPRPRLPAKWPGEGPPSRPCMLRHAFRRRRQQGQGLADQDLGLGARDQHAGAHLHGDMAETHLARDVLQGLALAAARDVGAQHVALPHRQRLLEIRVQLDAGKAGRLGQQPLRGQPRVLVALALEVAHRPIKGGLEWSRCRSI